VSSIQELDPTEKVILERQQAIKEVNLSLLCSSVKNSLLFNNIYTFEGFYSHMEWI
jgi:hypothetical protein